MAHSSGVVCTKKDELIAKLRAIDDELQKRREGGVLQTPNGYQSARSHYDFKAGAYDSLECVIDDRRMGEEYIPYRDAFITLPAIELYLNAVVYAREVTLLINVTEARKTQGKHFSLSEGLLRGNGIVFSVAEAFHIAEITARLEGNPLIDADFVISHAYKEFGYLQPDVAPRTSIMKHFNIVRSTEGIELAVRSAHNN